MPIYEYHSYEDEEHDLNPKNRGHLFDGRWIVKKDYEDIPSDTNYPDELDSYVDYLERADLFEHHDKRRIIMQPCNDFMQELTEHLALLIRDCSFQKQQQIRGLRLDWKNQEIKIGENVLERSDQWNEAVIVDRAGPLPNGDICFLLIKDGEHNRDKLFEYAHHCRLDSRDLKIGRDSRPIPLDSDDFNCIDLCGDIISGLSTSLLEIKRYNFRTGKLVDTILVHGLPPSICCLWNKFDNKVNRTPRGAWTSSHLFLWSNEGCEYPDNEDDIDEKFEYDATKVSSVYHVDLKTGVAFATTLNFNGWITEFVVGPEGNHIYIRVDEFLRRSINRDPYYHYRPPIYKFRYLRVPFNRPESLFFLASVALPRPLSPIALEIIKQNSKTAPIPLNIVQMTH